MAHQVIWTKKILDAFISEANLDDELADIMRTRVSGMTRVQQQFYFQMSERSLDRRIKKLKILYDEAQKHSDILPPRRTSVYEKYMDEH